MKYNMSEFDCFFISYDEPQKEEYWAHLQNIAPWAKRIDGVKGFDSAHKAAAAASDTDRFITVDGDNLVYPDFFELELNIPLQLQDCTLSWASKNIINGLCYGNGGLKLWTREFVQNMRTHENAEKEEERVDFCWDKKYAQMNNIYSDTCPNASPFQAFRAGFREGVKMTLDRGQRAGEGMIEKYMHDKNFQRLLVWASVGADVENGEWAIYGTRLGLHAANIRKDFDIGQISDYDWFKEYFSKEIVPGFAGVGGQRCRRTGVEWDPNLLRAGSTALLQPLRQHLGIKIADLNAEQSDWFKQVFTNPARTRDPLITEIEADKGRI